MTGDHCGNDLGLNWGGVGVAFGLNGPKQGVG